MAQALEWAVAASKQLTPLEVLLPYMNNPATSDSVRIECARCGALLPSPFVATETAVVGKIHEIAWR
jgi:hypothetical protein